MLPGIDSQHFHHQNKKVARHTLTPTYIPEEIRTEIYPHTTYVVVIVFLTHKGNYPVDLSRNASSYNEYSHISFISAMFDAPL